MSEYTFQGSKAKNNGPIDNETTQVDAPAPAPKKKSTAKKTAAAKK